MIQKLSEDIEPSRSNRIGSLAVLAPGPGTSRNDIADDSGVRTIHRSVVGAACKIQGSQSQFGSARNGIEIRPLTIVPSTADRTKLSQKTDRGATSPSKIGSGR